MTDQQKELLIAIGNHLCDWDDTPGTHVGEVADYIGLSKKETLEIAYSMEEALFRGIPDEDDYFQLSPYGWEKCQIAKREMAKKDIQSDKEEQEYILSIIAETIIKNMKSDGKNFAGLDDDFDYIFNPREMFEEYIKLYPELFDEPKYMDTVELSKKGWEKYQLLKDL